MKINKIANLNNIQSKENSNQKKVNTSTKEKNTPAAVFEKSKVEDKGHVYDKSGIDKIKMESAKSFDALKKMINKLLVSQGKAANSLGSDEMINIDAETRAEAAEMIGENGPYGVEAMSDSIADFAIALSGGDKSKLDTLIKAIDKGFSEAGKALGGLPDISMKTYDRIMEKLDIWKNAE